MIIEEIDESLFISRFEDYKRVVTSENKNGNFTYKGLRALFQYLEDTTDEGQPLKLDAIALCCDFSEYKDIEEYLNNYGTDLDKKDYPDIEDFNKALEEEINDKTTLIKFEDDINEGFIIQAY